MKKSFILISCLLIISCKRKLNENYLGKWTDGTWRHIAITADNQGYIVEDISGGGKKYRANLLGNELIVKEDNGNSTFNYLKTTDELFAGSILFHREDASKK